MLMRSSWLMVAALVPVVFLGGAAALGQTLAPAASAPATAPATAPASPTPARPVVVDPNQWRKSYAEQMMNSLAATENEWNAMEPLIGKIQALRAQLTTRSGSGMMAGWKDAGADQSDSVKEMVKGLANAAQELAKVLQEKDPGPDKVKFALKDYREARAAVRGELDKEQAELKRLLTPRQEAVLRQMSVLD